ncbi:Transposase [Piscirickettsia salmonis]|uniref:Transposase n=1 Tax=Piscirickettsia salmonis TaxID=1238 RepID=A0A1L6TBL8_PISSA|nr:transposase [Piscirickettsia salmonis]ALB22724.1 transposase [Piscirickettsia salmonis]ALT18385.1 hypothetical protein PSLF89_05720 [Piscirickettsia salmonis LF-89 = ATCC VR-1361]ALY02726.1 hypothetical protein AWE47_07550 [Piscirickettsia salmonis]AMA42272.1 hypothetical protein AWJ11_07735 [Piscirickettsia salmonis]AOS34747.1 hypothetical protein AVM72_04895 [Piscirickettsia salmonis]
MRKSCYSEEFRKEAVATALRSVSVTQTAKDLGIPSATLHTWVNQLKSQPKATKKSPDNEELLKENCRLNKELAKLREEKEILKKAARYFAQEMPE